MPFASNSFRLWAMYSSLCHPGSSSMVSTDLDGEDEREVPLKRSPERTNASMSAYCEATSELRYALIKVNRTIWES
jgi:hypothetical protein